MAEKEHGEKEQANRKLMRAARRKEGEDSGTETEEMGGEGRAESVATGSFLRVRDGERKRMSGGESVSGTDSEWDKVESEVEVDD